MSSEIVRELNRQQIIEVSTNLFIAQGIPLTSIRQIAKKSGVVDRTVLNIFGTKQNLVFECMKHLSEKILNEFKKTTSTQKYKSLSGLEQIMAVLRKRGELLIKSPEQLLLINEMKIWVARCIKDRQTVHKFIDKAEWMSQIIERAMEQGIADGSIDPTVNKEGALSMLVPSFRAILQQMALVKINAEYGKEVDVDKHLYLQFDIIRAGLENHTKKNYDY